MDQVAQIREKIDLVSLIAEHIPLKKAGINYKANCPFHNEKTPSFVVSSERQIWHCFGCQKGGDCFSFLMEYESLEFPEALRILAKKAGIELVERVFGETGISQKKEKIYRLNNLALEFYHYLLTKHNVGKKALQYLLEDRKINRQLIDTFKIGFSPRIGNTLSSYLINKKKYKREDLIEAGLSSQRGRDVVDFFSNRIIFPIHDHRGNIIGFSGRVIDPSVQISKYINTRETLVYHKGNVFFGLNLAKDEIKKEGNAIITEGEFDVISSFEEGIKNIVAVKGTALTENQVSLLSRFTEKVSLCFDVDKAGQDAIKRSLLVLEKKGLTTKVIVFPNGKDADESIKNDPIQFKKAVKNDIGIYDYLLSKILLNFDKKTSEGKRKITDELLPLFMLIENEIVKEHYFKLLAVEIDTSYESIVKQAERFKNNNVQNLKIEDKKEKRERMDVLAEYFLALILQSNTSFLEKVRFLGEFLPKENAYQKILAEIFNQKENLIIESFIKTLPVELLSAFDKCCLLPLPKFENQEKYLEEVKKVAEELKILFLKNKIKTIGEKIKEKEKKPEELGLEDLKIELSRAVSSLQASKSLD